MRRGTDARTDNIASPWAPVGAKNLKKELKRERAQERELERERGLKRELEKEQAGKQASRQTSVCVCLSRPVMLPE